LVLGVVNTFCDSLAGYKVKSDRFFLFLFYPEYFIRF
jgi:hypothetical protein